MTNTKLKIAFVWFGITGRYGVWRDGLWRAMKHIEEVHEVKYFEPSDDIESFNPDVIFFWEALCTSQSKDKDMWSRVINLPYKKYLLFAGGPIKREWAEPFDHIFVESKINADEFNSLGIKNSTAFGINEEIFKPEPQPKIWDAAVFGTCASWKRQGMIGKALGNRAVFAGRDQITDPQGFIDCRKAGALVFNEQPPETLNTLVNASHSIVNGAEFWGGGQRVTLEAMSANVPVICMSDSPKNREYVEESGFGLVCEPNTDSIRKAVEEIKTWQPSNKGRDYILSKWSSKHYAENLLKEL